MWKSESTRLRLLFVHDRFGAFAGAESNILAVARELQARGHAVGVLHGPVTGKGEAAWQNTFESHFPLAQKQNAPRVFAALETFQPDAIYVHKMADLETLQALLNSSLPLVRMVHDHELYCLRSYKYNFLTRQICQRAASPFCVFPCGAFLARNRGGGFPLQWVSYADKRREIEINKQFHRLIVGSQFMKGELLRNGFDPDKIEIHPPVPPSRDSSLQSNFNDRNLILYAGQIVRGKGVDVLLESLVQVREPFECFIFGDGNHSAFCEKLSRRLGLANRVHFKGYVPPDELKLYYRECSVAVVSSVWPEPFGAVGLEAMRHGVPVVAFDAGGIREWLTDGDNGFLVPWMDRAAFAARVGELLRDKPLARKLGECGRHTVAEQFEFSKYVDGLEHLFIQAAKKTNQPAFT
jgi:glycosyltransferase involved in cell wall biosynthesis